ncbi:MAG: O-antigen ligase family protein [Verrucomicrobiota bacterium]
MPSDPSPSSSPAEFPGRDAVARFRGELVATVPLHPLERALVIIAGLQLCMMPWVLGSMHPPAQFVAFGLALTAFVVSLITRNYDGEYTREGEFRLVMWRRLVRFPIFWIGLIFFAYIALQGANPFWKATVYPNGGYHTDPLENYIAWLPAGVEAPFMKMNAWRMLIIYGGAWLLACALWVGLSRRQAVQQVLTIIVVNAALIGLIAFLQRATGTREVLWLVKGKAQFFVGSFIYKNHAGAFFNMALACALALGLWHYRRAARRMSRSSPAPLFGLCAFVLAVVVVITYSRAATLLMIAYLAVAGVVLWIGWLRTPASGRNVGGMLMLVTMFVVAAAAGGYVLRFDKAVTRMEQALVALREGEGPSVTDRKISTRATFDMAQERLWTGWGSGSFRWVFPIFQKNYPEIWWVDQRPVRRSQATRFWLDAHNDYAQLLAELGVIGFAIGGSLLFAGVFLVVRSGGLGNPPVLLLVGGLALPLIHSWADNHSTNPAILCTFSAVLILAGRWSELEARR